ncbi:RNA-binding protein 12 [Pelomyxa schiedti]|nr:RNA-binding protein 12 [Pelomyxa schiedti]
MSGGIPLHLFFATCGVFSRCQVVVFAQGKKAQTGPPVKIGETEWLSPPPPVDTPISTASASPACASTSSASNSILPFSVPVPLEYCFEDDRKLILCVVFEGNPQFWETKIKLGKLVKVAFLQSRTKATTSSSGSCPPYSPQLLDLHQHLEGPLPLVEFRKPSGKVIMVKQRPPLVPGKLLVSAVDLLQRIPPSGVPFIQPLDLFAIKEIYTSPRWDDHVEYLLSVSAKDLIAADSGGTSDPYFVWKDGAEKPIIKSPVISKTLNPVWKKIDISNYFHREFGLVYLYDQDKFIDDYLGYCSFPFKVAKMYEMAHGDTLTITEQVRHNKHTSAGTVTFTLWKRLLWRLFEATRVEPLRSHPLVTNSDPMYLNIWPTATFLQSLSFGLKMTPWVAIDFVGSAHEIGDHPNPYETGIKAVGKVLKSYTGDDTIYFYGYGATLFNSCKPWFVMGQRGDGACKKGVKGAIKIYRKLVPRMIPVEGMDSVVGGDMYWRAKDKHYIGHDFYQMINHACDIMQWKLGGVPLNKMPPEYMVLCIFVSGDEFTIDYTKRAIIRASALPISIVLVGVESDTESEFHHLSQFDSDTTPLTFTSTDGKTVKAARDIVQFVKMKDCMEGGKLKKKRLRSRVLAEIPKQVESYLGLYGVSLV